jgi:U3 small nucleolar RNA-associated protein 21
LASANSEGAISVWNLDERILIGQLSQAHKGPIIWLHFLLGQPLLLSSGEDNKIVKWFFRNENSLPEVNTVLEGHSAPVWITELF